MMRFNDGLNSNKPPIQHLRVHPAIADMKRSILSVLMYRQSEMTASVEGRLLSALRRVKNAAHFAKKIYAKRKPYNPDADLKFLWSRK